MTSPRTYLAATAALVALALTARAQPTTQPLPARDVDVAGGDKVLYVVGYAHLDTQWRWAYPQVIREFVPDTLLNNFKLFDKYPNYVFNFSGSRRFEFMKEYYPADYERLKGYVAKGQWFNCGSSVDEADGLVPSAESMVRHILYGNDFFRREFGYASDEFMLPDCFGFSADLPTILAHNGILGFSTQKLSWGSAVGKPFTVGTWEGPDGSKILAALDPGAYVHSISRDLSTDESWQRRIENTGGKSGAFVDYHYYGVGDRGGAPDERSVQYVEQAAANKGGLQRVVSARADEMFHAITPEQATKLPTYKGELLLTEHSAGSITSQAYMKRWNRKNEQLADAAERASVAAAWLGRPYPSDRLYQAWNLVLGSQMHDILPGTSLPKAYEFSWNDEVLAGNLFAHALTDGVSAVAAQLDTRAEGVPLVVFNPLGVERTDPVEATVTFDAPAMGVRAFGPDGNEVPAQSLSNDGRTHRVLIGAKVPSSGFAVYDVRPTQQPAVEGRPRGNVIENDLFRVTINDGGDIASIVDKANGDREMLSSPIRLALQYENPRSFPAWNMDWTDRQKGPRAFVEGTPELSVVENGKLRRAVRITRTHERSKYVTTVRLTQGVPYVEVHHTIDWQGKESSLKASFPLAARNAEATYDGQIAALARGNNYDKRYESPQHQWFDVTDASGGHGVAILNDSKYGGDKPDDGTINLTLLYTPGVRGGYGDQSTQDIGRHEMTFALAPHAGDWRTANVPWTAARLNQPLRAFATPRHAGPLGKSFSLVSCDNPQVMVSAVKKAEHSDEIVVRLRELHGEPATGVRLTFGGAVQSAREVDGQERPKGEAKIESGALVADVRANSLTAFAVKLAPPAALPQAPRFGDYNPPFTRDVMSTNDDRADGEMADGLSFPAEMVPSETVVGGVPFTLGPKGKGENNAFEPDGQTIDVPEGATRVHVLAAATKDTPVEFKIGDATVKTTFQAWGGYVGQWDNRLWESEIPEQAYDVRIPMAGLVPGFVKPAEIAWFATHQHSARGDEHYKFSYLFKHTFDVPAGARTITLPTAPDVRFFASTVEFGGAPAVAAAAPLFDTFADRGGDENEPPTLAATGPLNDATTVVLQPPLYYKKGNFRYTLDGSEPTADSATYDEPIPVSARTVVTAREFADGKPAGPAARQTFDVNDTTAPRIVAADAVASTVRVEFSEPVSEATANDSASYALEPAAKVERATLGEGGKVAVLRLADPPAFGATVKVRAAGVADRSPQANRASADAAFDAKVVRPVFALEDVGAGSQTIDAPNLPTRGRDPFTLNVFVRVAKEPPNRSLLVGFGSAERRGEGRGRFLAKFGGGLHFWSEGRDVESIIPYELNEWQMVTATYDGTVLRLYRNGQLVNSGEVRLRDDSDRKQVHVRPIDPWEGEVSFDGELRDVTVWDGALSAELLQGLWGNAKK